MRRQKEGGSSMAVKRKRITFTGRVQGVGFRYRASFIAQNLGLTGWVKNEWDESVTAEAQGEEEVIDLFVERMYRERYIRIEGMDVVTIPLQEKEKGFRIAY